MSKRVRLKGKGSLTLKDEDGFDIILKEGRSMLVSDEVYERAQHFCDVVGSEWRLLRKKILKIWVPDGIGDIHWVFLKLQSLVGKCGAEGVDLYVRDLSPVRPRRCEEFVKMNPLIRKVFFVKKGFEFSLDGVLIEEGGFDYVLDPTDWLTSGRELADWLPSLKINFEYPFAYKRLDSIYPDRVVLYFGNESSEQMWGGGWNVGDWAYLVRVLSKRFSIWVVGLDCDLAYSNKVAEAGCVFVNRVGETSFKEVLDLITTSSLFVASVSGLPIVSTFLNHPTVCVWPGASANQSFPSKMRYSWVGERSCYYPISFEAGGRDVAKLCLKVLL